MRFMTGFRAALVALSVAAVGFAATAEAASGRVNLSFFKGGWVIGGTAGSGVMSFQGRRYPLTIGGISYGLTFGGSQTNLSGRVTNIRRPSDIAGVYGAASAGVAVGPAGRQFIQLRNEKGAILILEGRQVGLIASLDLSGMAISIR